MRSKVAIFAIRNQIEENREFSSFSVLAVTESLPQPGWRKYLPSQFPPDANQVVLLSEN
jgi:hypothetical protein